MKIVEDIMTHNPCYKKQRKIEVKGLMLHSVGCPQSRASSFISSWNKEEFTRACVHAFIDGNSGNVHQTLPWEHRGWHCGGRANNTHIGIEMCEPDCIRYNKGSSFECSNLKEARIVANRTYLSAVSLFATLCKKYNLNPLEDGVVISHREGHQLGIASNHGDPEHLWKGLGLPFTMKKFRKDVQKLMEEKQAGSMQAAKFKNMEPAEIVDLIGPLFTEDEKQSGVLASVSMAQFLLESGYGKSELAQKANNCFGMKKILSSNNWKNSKWDGVSIYTKITAEQNDDGSYRSISADFRKYCCIEDSIADHSAYLLGAKKGVELRYKGIKGNTDYKKVAQIIKDGGYATSHTYVEKLCKVIEKWNLTRFDVKDNLSKEECPFLVRVEIDDLNIREGAGTNTAKTGKQTGKGIFTIVALSEGKGAASGWGKLKSGAGWISLDYCTRL